MRKAIAVLLLVTLATVAVAGDKPDAGRMDIDTFLRMNRTSGPAYTVRALFEGFEADVFPVDWTVGVTNPSHPWDISAGTQTGALEGDYCAFVSYDIYDPSDETLSFDHLVDVAGLESVLTFWMAGSRAASWAGNVAETVEVNGETVFDFDTATEADFTWEKFSVDLGAWDGQTVTITFRYAGLDGDLHVLDAVMIDDGAGYTPPPPPEPPVNDVCDGAIDLQEQSQTVFEIDLCEYTAQSSPGAIGNSCTYWTANGPDAMYTIWLSAGEVFTACAASTDGLTDLSVYLVADCWNPQLTCLAGSDTGDPECISYVAPAEGWYKLIVDSYSGCGLVEVTIDAPVSNENMEWGQVKSLY